MPDMPGMQGMPELAGKAGFAGFAGFADLNAAEEAARQTVTNFFTPTARSNMLKNPLDAPPVVQTSTMFQKMIVSTKVKKLK
jgi:hypothetical protein